ncbi:MAG: transcriptional repressor [Geobacter sp.]|nr:MAG: transcriptional repressor [Geobacter sp.]
MKRAKKKQFQDFIAEKGLKSTRQRDLVLECFLSSDCHLSTEDLYMKVRAKNPSIGFATVYRTLKLFAEAGIAREIHFGDGQSRYEHVAEGEHHDHLICTRCGAVQEFQNEAIEELQQEVAEQFAFQVETHKLELYGICSKCRK